jgi:hypothetical protein
MWSQYDHKDLSEWKRKSEKGQRDHSIRTQPYVVGFEEEGRGQEPRNVAAFRRQTRPGSSGSHL